MPDRETLLARAATIESRYRLPARQRLRLVRPAPMSILQGASDMNAKTATTPKPPGAKALLWPASPKAGSRLAQLPALAREMA